MIVNIFGLDINLPSQILGLIGCFFCIYSFFSKNKVKFLIFCSLGYIFCLGEAILLLFSGSNTYANIIATSLAILRNIIMWILLKKKNMEVPLYVSIIFTLLIWIGSIPFYEGWYTLIPPIAMSVSTIALYFKNFIFTKIGNIIFEALYLAYGIIVGAYSGLIRDGFGLVAAIVSIIVYLFASNKVKKIKDN